LPPEERIKRVKKAHALIEQVRGRGVLLSEAEAQKSIRQSFHTARAGRAKNIEWLASDEADKDEVDPEDVDENDGEL